MHTAYPLGPLQGRQWRGEEKRRETIGKGIREEEEKMEWA